MSALFGVYAANREAIEQQVLATMLELLHHRGPDNANLWLNGHIGLGHCMLQTTLESLREKLPFHDQRAGLTITADARLDNRADLMVQLGLLDQCAADLPDSQLILAAYEKWGNQCAQKLLGDFAFAIWDESQQTLFCVRDAMGVKPFYYYASTNKFIFASAIKAILSVPAVPCRLNETKIADFLVPIFRDQKSTSYQDIFRLPPAHCMVVSRDGLQSWSYWQLDSTRELHLASDEEYVEAFREYFVQAVHCRLRSAFPVGSTLSGGLDSSSVACVAGNALAEAGKERLHTFSAIFPTVAEQDARIDERSYIDIVLQTGKFIPHFVNVEQCQPLANVTWYKDEALPGASLYMGRTLFRTAAEHNVRVMLCGFDGDGTVSYGYEYLQTLARQGKWADFAREAHALAQLRPQTNAVSYLHRFGLYYWTELLHKHHWLAFAKQTNAIAEHFGLSRRRLVLNLALKPLLSPYLLRLQHKVQGRVQADKPLGIHRALHPTFVRRTNLDERVRTLEAFEFTNEHAIREQHKRYFTDGQIEFVVNTFDHTTATFGLEQRYPFLDRRLIEFSLALPYEQKLRNGWTRFIFRRAMENILPPAVQWRVSKANLSSNSRLGLLQEREILDKVILEQPEPIADYIDIPVLQRIYRNYLAQPLSVTEADFFTIFHSANLALWLRNTGFA